MSEVKMGIGLIEEFNRERHIVCCEDLTLDYTYGDSLLRFVKTNYSKPFEIEEAWIKVKDIATLIEMLNKMKEKINQKDEKDKDEINE